MICKHCFADVKFEYSDDWTWFAQIPFYCLVCNKTTWVDQEFAKNDYKLQSDRLPNLLIGSVVVIRNKQHDRFEEIGSIVEKSHLHYRILFDDNTSIWMPHHWVRTM